MRGGIDRRGFLRGASAVAGMAVVGAASAACSGTPEVDASRAAYVEACSTGASAVGGRYEQSAAQQLWGENPFMMWATDTCPWPLFTADPLDLPRDRSPVAGFDTGSRMSLPGDLAVGGFTTVWANSIGGIPAQVVPETAPLQEWTFGDTVYGYATRTLPTPTEIWVEGMPRTRVFPWEQPPGAYDRHVIFVYPDRVVEMIGVDHPRFAAMAAVEYDTTTGAPTWVFPSPEPMPPDAAVCAGGVQMSRYMLTPQSLVDPHVLGVALGDYGGSDGTLDTTFPRCRQRVVLEAIPPGLTGDALRVAEILATFGAVVYDRTGTGQDGCLLVQPGAQWDGSDLTGVTRIPLDAFRLATATTPVA